MREEQIRELILDRLRQIAPEADLETLDPDRRYRDQFQFDSVDFLNFALSLQEQLKIALPEEDYPALATLNGCMTYLATKLQNAGCNP